MKHLRAVSRIFILEKKKQVSASFSLLFLLRSLLLEIEFLFQLKVELCFELVFNKLSEILLNSRRNIHEHVPFFILFQHCVTPKVGNFFFFFFLNKRQLKRVPKCTCYRSSILISRR